MGDEGQSMMNLQDWLAAIDAIDRCGHHDTHDAKPLAALLRSQEPIPTQIRNMLADMLDPPSGADFIDVHLVPKPTRSKAKYTRWARRRRAYLAYIVERDKGRSEADALEAARQEWHFDDKSNFHAAGRIERTRGIAWREWMARCGWKLK